MQAGAVATKGVLGDACAACYRERRGMADGGARVPEVLSAAELEGFFAGFVPEPLEPALGASMGEDVEEEDSETGKEGGTELLESSNEVIRGGCQKPAAATISGQ